MGPASSWYGGRAPARTPGRVQPRSAQAARAPAEQGPAARPPAARPPGPRQDRPGRRGPIGRGRARLGPRGVRRVEPRGLHGSLRRRAGRLLVRGGRDRLLTWRDNRGSLSARLANRPGGICDGFLGGGPSDGRRARRGLRCCLAAHRAGSPDDREHEDRHESRCAAPDVGGAAGKRARGARPGDEHGRYRPAYDAGRWRGMIRGDAPVMNASEDRTWRGEHRLTPPLPLAAISGGLVGADYGRQTTGGELRELTEPAQAEQPARDHQQGAERAHQ